MVIRLTKGHKKPSGKAIPKGTIIEVVEGHPYKDFEIVIQDGNLDSKKNELAAAQLETDEAKKNEKEAAEKKTKTTIK